MTVEWEAPVQRLILQLDDLKVTLQGIDQTKNQLRPELERMTIELTSLLGAQNSRVEPLLEFPRILKSILANKQVGAIVFGPNGEKLLFNDRAQWLLSGLGGGESGIFRADGTTRLTQNELPWVEALHGSVKKMEDSELIIKKEGQLDQPIWLRVTVSTLAGPESGEIGGAIAFLAEITEHVAVVNELTNLCSELEQRLDNITLASKELDMLSRKLTRVRSQDIELADNANKEHAYDHDDQDEHEQVRSSARAKDQSGGEEVKVLVADDVAVNQKLLKLQLERMGFAVTLVKSGSEAVEAVRSSDFDLILMDCDMPEVDGYEATTQIRALEPAKAQIPIIAVTAYDREGDREKCLTAGMNDFITKGSPETVLRQSITKWVPARSHENGQEHSGNRARVVLFDDAKEPSALLSSRSAEGPIDIKQLESTYGASEAEAILRLFVGVSGTFVECLELAVESKDAEAVSHFAYSIKGPCASLGLNHMAKKATQLAECGVKNRWREAMSIYQELKEFYTPVDKQISAILSQLPLPEASS